MQYLTLDTVQLSNEYTRTRTRRFVPAYVYGIALPAGCELQSAAGWDRRSVLDDSERLLRDRDWRARSAQV